jgi:protein transport protein SEC31
LGCTNEDETKIFDFNKATSKDESADTSYAPSWLYRPVGARFGFGGKLVTFSSNPQEPIKLYQTQTAPEICSKLQRIEKMREKEEFTTIIDAYVEKSGSNEIERMEWATIRSLCTKNYDSIFTLLDIDKDSVLNEAERFSGKKKLKTKVAQKDSSLKTNNKGLDDLDANQANEFFATLAETSEKRKEEEDKKIETKVGQKTIQETISRNSNWDEGAEGIIKRNLLIGNIEGAAE